MRHAPLRRRTPRRWAGTGILLALAAAPLLAQSPPAGEAAGAGVAAPASMRALSDLALTTLAQPRYADLSALEQRVVGSLAIYAAIMVDSGWCADASAGGSAAEIYLFNFSGAGRQNPALQPVFHATEEHKSHLVDDAMEVEAQRQSAHDLRADLCHGQLLAAAAVKPLAERRAMARQVLALGLAAPPGGAPVVP